MSRTTIATSRAPRAIGPYSQAVATNDWIFCSGQIPLDPATGKLVPGDIQAQTRRCLENLKAVLEAGGATLAQVVKTTVYLTDLGQFAAVNEAYGEYFGSQPPARATVQVSALPAGATVEIDAIARRGG
ncbi:MAG: RidA family protein [Planctomycetota bacterium]